MTLHNERALRQKTISSLGWSAFDNSINQIIHFIVGIILARLLTPKEYGLVGMITIFIVISQVFIDSGFNRAIIRKIDCDDEDYSTVFFFNLAVSIILYTLLFLGSGYIADFFNEPQLKALVRVTGLNLIINAFGIVQAAIRTKRLDFKLQAKISSIASLTSGVIGILAALFGWGVWSLVFKTLSQNIFTTVLLWIWNKWKPVLIFSKRAFHEMFSFSYKLLISTLIDKIYLNAYYFIIGKYFSAETLGYYTRATNFMALPSINITVVIQRVSYPVLSMIQQDKVKLKKAYKKLLKNTMYISFTLLFGMAAVSHNLIKVLVGAKWLPAAEMLQLLCFVGMMHPLQALNLNMLNVLGRSDLFLKLEIFKKSLAVPTIILGILFGIKVMILGMVVNAGISYIINSYYSGDLIGYSMKEQIKDIFPSFLVSLVMGVCVFTFGRVIPYPEAVVLAVQIIVGAVITIIISSLLRLESYHDFKEIICKRIKQI